MYYHKFFYSCWSDETILNQDFSSRIWMSRNRCLVNDAYTAKEYWIDSHFFYRGEEGGNKKFRIGDHFLRKLIIFVTRKNVCNLASFEKFNGCNYRPGFYSPGLPDFSWYMIPKSGKCTKWIQNVPKGHKISQIPNIPNVLKYINIFRSNTHQTLPKLGFLVWKQTIWQPCYSLQKRILLIFFCLKVQRCFDPRLAFADERKIQFRISVVVTFLEKNTI
jgi:hypothetical protein